MLDEIQGFRADADGWVSKAPIPLERIRAWMQSADLEVLGSAYKLLRYRNGLERAEPAVPWPEFAAYVQRYFEICLAAYDTKVEPPVWVHAHWGMEATHEVAYVFEFLYRNKEVDRKVVEDFRDWIMTTLERYPEVRGLLATAIFDHVLYHRTMKKLFPTDSPLFRP